MASDKRKTGYTLTEKCQDEEDKLRKKLAEDLKQDMKRLFTDGILTDLVIRAGKKEYHVHKIIFKEMGYDIYSEMMALPNSSEEESLIVLDSVSNTEELSDVLSSFYTDDDISLPVEKMRNYIKMSVENNAKTHPDTADHLNTNCNHLEMNNVLNDLPNDVNRVDNHIKSLLEVKVENFVKQIIINAQRIVTSTQNTITDQSDETSLRLVDSSQSAEGDESTTAIATSSDNHSISYKEHLDSNVVENSITNEKNKSSEFGSLRTSCKEISRIPGGAGNGSISEIVWKELSLKKAPKACSVLGEDLLRKLVRHVAADCIVSVGDWEFPAHRCVLAARSSYFAMMLNGSWMESDQEQIMLEGIDASVVKQMLLYIYGGVLDLDPACSIGGLVMAADMYDIVGMKSIISFTLNKDYCHFFHKPCPECIAGVPETLPLTMMYNMENMCEKCVRWINKHKEKVWPTKTFALLPQECLDYCSSTAVKDLNIINIIDCLLECQRLNEKIPRLKWSDSVLNCVATLMDSALEYASQNFVNIISGKEFKRLDGKSLGFNMRALEEIFSLVMTSLSPGVACQSYLALHTLWTQIETVNKAQQENRQSRSGFEETYARFSEEYTSLVEKLCKKCKEQLCLYIHQAVNTSEWFLLSTQMQKDIMDEANYVCIDSPGRGKMAARPKLTSMKKKPLSSDMRVSMKEYFDRHFGPKETFPTEAIEKPKEKSKVPRKVDKTKTSATKNSPVSGKAMSLGKGASQKACSDELKLNSRSQGVVKTVSQAKNSLKKSAGQGKSSSQIAKGDKKVAESTSNMKSGVSKTCDKNIAHIKKAKSPIKTKTEASPDAKSAKSKSEKYEPSKDKTSHSLFANIRKEAEAGSSEVLQRSHIDSTSEKSEEMITLEKPRERSQSASASIFKPRYGFGYKIQSAQSSDSFFSNSRAGLRTVVPRPLPILNVQFVVPHEFSEQF